jgi:hypothetical protein
MKKQVLASLLVILFASCNSTTPQKSAEKFLNGFVNNDSSAMLSCATDNTKELVRFYFMIRLDSIQFDKKISVSPKFLHTSGILNQIVTKWLQLRQMDVVPVHLII